MSAVWFKCSRFPSPGPVSSISVLLLIVGCSHADRSILKSAEGSRVLGLCHIYFLIQAK